MFTGHSEGLDIHVTNPPCRDDCIATTAPDILHFITTSCYQRRALLGSGKNRDLFLHVLEQVRRRYHFVVVGYVVMPEHVHLLFGEPDRGNPSIKRQNMTAGDI